MSAAARPATPRTATGQGPQAVAGRPQIASGLVAFIVGETSRASGSKSRSRPSAKPAGQLEGKAGASAKPSSTEWKFRWSAGRPGAVVDRRRLRTRPDFDPQPRRCRTREERSARPERGVHAGKAEDLGRQCPLVRSAFLDHYPGIRGGVGCVVNGALRQSGARGGRGALASGTRPR